MALGTRNHDVILLPLQNWNFAAVVVFTLCFMGMDQFPPFSLEEVRY